MTDRLRRSPRLPSRDYIGPLAAHVVMVSRRRAPLFTHEPFVEIGLHALGRAQARFPCDLRAYCFMPDHLHLLVFVNERVSLQDFVRHFKQISGFAIKAETGEEAWQISYYDRILRNDEDLQTVARYVWSNPVTAGLVDDALLYPFPGPPEALAQT